MKYKQDVYRFYLGPGRVPETIQKEIIQMEAIALDGRDTVRGLGFRGPHHSVLTVQKQLRAVGVGARVGHRETASV